MTRIYSSFNKNITTALKAGEVGIIPTDTLYGLVGSALKPDTVRRIYKLRKRNTKKPCIVLIYGYAELEKFGVRLKRSDKKIIQRFWPGPVSIILSCTNNKFSYLHRGTHTIAFRMPKSLKLRRLLRSTGALVAPSANPEGKRPATSIADAQHYFGEKADFYVHAGIRKGRPSSLIEIHDGKIKKLR